MHTYNGTLQSGVFNVGELVVCQTNDPMRATIIARDSNGNIIPLANGSATWIFNGPPVLTNKIDPSGLSAVVTPFVMDIAEEIKVSVGNLHANAIMEIRPANGYVLTSNSTTITLNSESRSFSSNDTIRGTQGGAMFKIN